MRQLLRRRVACLAHAFLPNLPVDFAVDRAFLGALNDSQNTMSTLDNLIREMLAAKEYDRRAKAHRCRALAERLEYEFPVSDDFCADVDTAKACRIAAEWLRYVAEMLERDPS